MHGRWLGAMILVGALLLLASAETVHAQRVRMKHQVVDANNIEVLRIYRHPSLQPGHMILEIFLKDPNAPAFAVHGPDGRHLESLLNMIELSYRLRSGLMILYEETEYTWETNHPYFLEKPYKKKVYTVFGVYPFGISGIPGGGAPLPPSGQSGASEMIPAEPLELLLEGQQRGEPPEGEPMRERMTDDAPPQEHLGFCCLRGEVFPAPPHVCAGEGGAFFRDPDSARMRCQPGGR